MNLFPSSRLLRHVLWLDAASAAGCAALQLAAAPLMVPLLGIAPDLLLASGAVLAAVAAFAGWLASQHSPPAALVRTLAAGNGAWAIGCVALLATGGAATLPGQLYVLVQLVAVAVLGELEWFARPAVPRWA